MNATDAYCAIVCPAAEMNFRDPGFQTAMDTCEDFACIQQVRIAEIFTEGRQDDAENVDTVASSSFLGRKYGIRISMISYIRIRARSRLYRSQILQINTRWKALAKKKALAETYIMHSFAQL